MYQHVSTVVWLKTALGCTSLALCLLMLANRRYPEMSREPQKYTTQQTTRAEGIIRQARSHVTKSLSELGTMRSLSDHILMFSFIPHTGSELIVLLLQKLQGRNNFKHVRLKNEDGAGLDSFGQEAMLDHISEIIRSNAVPLTLDRRMYFLNFTRYGRQSPTYLSVVRDPIDMYFARFHKNGVNKFKYAENKSRVISDCFLFGNKECRFEDQQELELSINYFCGQDYRCKLLNNDWALAKAKSSVDRYYAAVGVYEEFGSSLELFQLKMNYFFRGVTDLYKQMEYRHQTSIASRPKLKKRYMEYLKYSLRNELTFYKWILSKLKKQMYIAEGTRMSSS